MSEVIDTSTPQTAIKAWTGFQKFVFRTFFVFFVILIVPFNSGYYKNWFTTDWKNLHIRDIGKLSGSSFSPVKVATKRDGGNDTGGIPNSKQYLYTIYPQSGEFGLESYINWGIAFVLGLIGAAIWTLADRKPRNYDILYYFLGVLVSYAMLIQLNGLTFSKMFPTQMPDLALTQLNTPFGDFVAQKLYWIQFSFVHNYERFAGWAELTIMLLLFFRQTRAFGAALALAMIGNIAFANHAYDGGIHLAASFYALGGAFVLWRYIPSLWRLLVKEQDTQLGITYYPFKKTREKYFRIAFKAFVFLFFFVLAGYLHWDNYKHDSYKVPSRPGLANARGLYSVDEFKLNNKVLPYSPVDSLRWQNVTLEKWSTLSFTVFNTFMIHGEAGRGKQIKDIDRTYESAGTGGGRRHFYYEIDSANQILHLQNKNKVYKDQKLDLHYQRPTPGQLVLWGKNEYQDSIYLVLNRRDKTYPIFGKREDHIIWKP
ncbi:hypothetical protein FW774_16040 [Pedobacter sp. BS3]|uniref:hypothetical protein n=1 Tax=Pedobacter sp. BS3 TaxID=2567937 RepID=UPI0011EC23F5|nr:hypothetical protein [Pedobacter sp. BS3]TZF82201.1 hypothetical protein FW774_16040 [Pedobacter sp. BS3]